LESAHALICGGLLPVSNRLLVPTALRTEGGHLEMGIDEDAALALRTDLERFLTQ
jgi:hypothetical protein